MAGIILVGKVRFPVLVYGGVVDDDNRKCEVGDVACLEHEAENH